MHTLGNIHYVRNVYEQAVAWLTKGAEAGLPPAMRSLGRCLEEGKGVAPPDYLAAVDWYRRAADAGNGEAACALSNLYTFGRGRNGRICLPHFRRILSKVVSYNAANINCQALGRGVTRSKRKAMQWRRKAAENGIAQACLHLAGRMYMDLPYAREVGHVGEAAGVAASAGVMEGHDVPTDTLTSVVHWLRKGGHPVAELDSLRRGVLEGGAFCRNEGCEVVGHLKNFKVCPQCKHARYCGDACQKADWTTGGHKATCGTAEQT